MPTATHRVASLMVVLAFVLARTRNLPTCPIALSLRSSARPKSSSGLVQEREEERIRGKTHGEIIKRKLAGVQNRK